MFYSLVRFLLRTLGRILFWPKVSGLDNVPDQGPVILVTNHLGVGEAILLVAFMRRPVIFPAKQELFRTNTPPRWLFTMILRGMHQVPMDRTGGEAAADGLGCLHQVLAESGMMAIMPEGHRSEDGRLYKGRTGVARLALASSAPVVPIGCFRTRFVFKWLPFPWLFRPEARIGEPFHFPEETKRAYLEASSHDEAAIVLRQATDEVMRRIQAITGQEMVDSYSYHPKKASQDRVKAIKETTTSNPS